MRIHQGAALDEERGKTAVVIEDTPASSPPVAPRIDVGARAEQEVDHLPVAPLYRAEKRGAAEGVIGHGIVKPGLQLRMTFQNLADPGCVVGFHSRRQRLEGIDRARHGRDMRFELWPTGKPVCAGEHQLRVTQREFCGADFRL